jgi:hypothetical protein
MPQIDYRFARGLWLARLKTRHGVVEVLVDGKADRPKESDVSAVNSFAVDLDQNLTCLKSRLRLSFLYHPIRIAVNRDGQVGVQFRNWLTGNQATVAFYNEV